MENVKNKLKYFTPAKHWEIFHIKSRSQFIKSYVIPNNFHKLVQEDVNKAYLTAQYLMAHSWYYWQMYDEAVKKMTNILEIAIKQKTKQLSLPLKKEIKNGKEISKSLNELITEIDKAEPNKSILEPLLKAKEIRNYLAHPDRNSFMGGMETNLQRIKYYINIINLLFLSYYLFKNYPQQISKLNEFQKNVNDNLYTIQLEKKKYLIHKIHHFRLLPLKEEQLVILGFSLVTTDTYNLIKDGKFGDPKLVALEIKDISGVKLVGKELLTNSEIIIERTNHPNNLKLQNTFQQDLHKSDETIVGSMIHLLDSESAWLIENYIFNNVWNKYYN